MPKLLGFSSGIQLTDDESTANVFTITGNDFTMQSYNLSKSSLPLTNIDGLAALTPHDATCVPVNVPMPALLRIRADANTQVCFYCIPLQCGALLLHRLSCLAILDCPCAALDCMCIADHSSVATVPFTQWHLMDSRCP